MPGMKADQFLTRSVNAHMFCHPLRRRTMGSTRGAPPARHLFEVVHVNLWSAPVPLSDARPRQRAVFADRCFNPEFESCVRKAVQAVRSTSTRRCSRTLRPAMRAMSFIPADRIWATSVRVRCYLRRHLTIWGMFQELRRLFWHTHGRPSAICSCVCWLQGMPAGGGEVERQWFGRRRPAARRRSHENAHLETERAGTCETVCENARRCGRTQYTSTVSDGPATFQSTQTAFRETEMHLILRGWR